MKQNNFTELFKGLMSTQLVENDYCIQSNHDECIYFIYLTKNCLSNLTNFLVIVHQTWNVGTEISF